jgi:cation diffusion facilitator family transporter
MTEHGTETHGIWLALVGYSLLVVLQLVAYLLTNILLLYAQALEMFSDVLVSIFLLFSIRWSRKPADEFHMFGHGRSQNVAGLVSAVIFVSFMALEVFREANPKFWEAPQAGQFQNPSIAIAVIAASMIVLAIPVIDILRVKTKGASSRTQLVQLLKDEFSYVPAIIGVILVAQGYLLADAVTSTIIGIIIVLGGLYLFKDNLHYLVGKAPNREFLARLESTARSVDGVLSVHDLRAEYVGPNAVHAGLHVGVARGTPVEEADRIAHEVERRVSQDTSCQYCIIHVDPANGPSTRSKEVK